MTLAQHLTLLAEAVRDKFNIVTPRLMPPGGTLNQVLTKTAAADNAAAWQTPAAGGGGGLTQAQVLKRTLGC